jgi:hypothetical protein
LAGQTSPFDHVLGDARLTRAQLRALGQGVYFVGSLVRHIRRDVTWGNRPIEVLWRPWPAKIGLGQGLADRRGNCKIARQARTRTNECTSKSTMTT